MWLPKKNFSFTYRAPLVGDVFTLPVLAVLILALTAEIVTFDSDVIGQATVGVGGRVGLDGEPGTIQVSDPEILSSANMSGGAKFRFSWVGQPSVHSPAAPSSPYRFQPLPNGKRSPNWYQPG